jgi:hypothetical protein
VLRRSSMGLLARSAALTLLMLTAGCGSSGDGTEDVSDGYEYVEDTGDSGVAATANPTPSPPPGQSPITAREVTGHWVSSEYGDAYLQVTGAEVRVVYGQEGGRMVGSLRGSMFSGWWSEAPTRTPADDAGEVQLTFVRSGGKLTAQGWWRPGTDAEFESEWTMQKVDGLIPAAIRTDFANRSQFVRHP